MLTTLAADRSRLIDLAAQISDLERSIAGPMLDPKCAIVAQILDIVRPLSAVHIEQALLQARLDAYKYPVLTLPNEITSEIFIHFVPGYPHPPPLVGTDSPTTLTAVCRKWREVAHAIPALWRAIWFGNWGIPYERENQIFDAWLQRCGSRPLSVKIQNRRGGIIYPERIPVILAQRARWEHLRLVPLFEYSFRTINGPMPLLRYLELEFSGSHSGGPAFRDVPQLREVVLKGYEATHVALPWEQLTSLTIANAIPRPCLAILQQTVNLVKCRLLDTNGLSDQYLYPPPNVTLPRLESLEFETSNGRRPTSAIGFLDAFIVPALCRFRVKEGSLGPHPIDYLTSFISRSGCTLAKLHITGERKVPEVAYSLAFPSICEISFAGSHPKDMSEEEDAGSEDEDEEDSDGDEDASDSDHESNSSDIQTHSDSDSSSLPDW
ncbi:hypothetical protein K438DRAFT_1987541 [Mycena galopus ATCC 62051]|nr:hypothetical protein K438DRAFT_1987541 [Mycena galopus ATCC 62051]